MTPEARLALVIELLDEIAAAQRPADLVAGAFLRARRFIGAKDRRALSDRLWGILRRRARLAWTLRALGAEPSPRLMVLADLVLADAMTIDAVAALCPGGGRAPAPLMREERALLERISTRRLFHHDMPAWVRGEYPEWIEPRLSAVFGDRLAVEMGALRDEAPVDLRVNLLRTDRDGARAALAAGGIEAQPTALSPWGLRLPARTALMAQEPFRDGLVEVQDEGSQLLALLTGAKPGQAVVDFCAGAGGKTLALAAMMANKGRLVACDVHDSRLKKAAERLRRAGAHNVTRHVLTSEADKWVKRQAGSFDAVLVDAPCSGTGTWRRNPDAKWRLTPEDVAELVALQGRILASAARLTRPGGRLVYATCSLLAEEGEDRIAAFLKENADFRLLPLPGIWAENIGTDCPLPGPYLRLSPASTGTDGFFAAVLERAAPS
ncbi:MAG: RsmB/NOP family class I SAM-dependent RNA methyltransferase [Rhodospirillaceae bacterium]|nr:RsmB/NOP family class I SAM-dependent RNA methyltransferase [Rhodospirillaceae bacterium]